MPVALITLREANASHSIAPEKEDGRNLRGEFVHVEDGTSLYENRQTWQIGDKNHFFLFVPVPETIDGKPWLQHYQEWLLSRHEAQTHGNLVYSFADRSYQQGEQVVSQSLSGTVHVLEEEQVYGIQFEHKGNEEKLKDVRTVTGKKSGVRAEIREIEVNELNGNTWFVVDNRTGHFDKGERLLLDGKPRGRVRVLRSEYYTRGKMLLSNVVVTDDQIGEDEILVGQSSGAQGLMIEGNATRLARTKRFLPLSLCPPQMQSDFAAKRWCACPTEADFKNCVKRHPDETMPDRDPDVMDSNALDDDARA